MARSRVREMEPPSGRLLVVSPHLDDAALSCAALLGRREPVDVLTVFAGQPQPPFQGWWDRTTGFASSADSIGTRLKEEHAAYAGSPHRVQTLSLLEVQYVDDRRPPEDAGPIRDAVAEWLACGPGTIAIPAGAGRGPGRLRARLQRIIGPTDGAEVHPDHVFARDLVLSIAGSHRDVQILVYEELPYRWSGRPHQRVRRAAASAGRAAEPVDMPVDRNVKAARIRFYASQVPHLTIAGRRVDDPAALPPEERYWLLAPLRRR